jgi:2'-5' RNA ligase
MQFPNGGSHAVNSFSLVAYIPGKLGEFLNGLRTRLVPGCEARAHITILPPRPLECPWITACTELQPRVLDVHPFRVELDSVHVFEDSQVVYLSLNAGRRQFEQLHRITNRGRLQYTSPFEYLPHVTLAHGLTAEELGPTRARAEAAWEEYSGPREFVIEELVLVQSTSKDLWVDLATLSLSGRPALLIRR